MSLFRGSSSEEVGPRRSARDGICYTLLIPGNLVCLERQFGKITHTRVSEKDHPEIEMDD